MPFSEWRIQGNQVEHLGPFVAFLLRLTFRVLDRGVQRKPLIASAVTLMKAVYTRNALARISPGFLTIPGPTGALLPA